MITKKKSIESGMDESGNLILTATLLMHFGIYELARIT